MPSGTISVPLTGVTLKEFPVQIASVLLAITEVGFIVTAILKLDAQDSSVVAVTL